MTQLSSRKDFSVPDSLDERVACGADNADYSSAAPDQGDARVDKGCRQIIHEANSAERSARCNLHPTERKGVFQSKRSQAEAWERDRTNQIRSLRSP
jgi:hypothetical protein